MNKQEPSCQVVRALDVIGEKWSLLIVRNALRGQTKFSEFQAQLGVSSDILTARLGTLVDAGVFRKEQYREPGGRERSCYHLTEAGEGLRLVVAAMMQWSTEFNPAPVGGGSRVVNSEGAPLALAFVDPAGRTHSTEEALIVPGPTSNWAPR
jgi:DNA-binding HxlR family transcriptional regulator